jgi:MoxR-like ATPase
MDDILTCQNACIIDDDYESAARIRAFLNSVLRGKAEVIEQVLVCLFAQGHLLIEDKPGLGKTTLAKALARAVGGRFARVQCTPDLLPGDITGFSIYNQKIHEFEFRQGPVFSEVLLADEINRATPRTQSALLEAMAERQVTVDTVRYPLAEEFFVIATQNPIDQHGTFPLPEAQLDRFAMKLSVGYPHPRDELQMLRDATRCGDTSPGSGALIGPSQLRRTQQAVQQIAVADPVQDYLVRLADTSRRHPHVMLGVSPRGLLAWQRTAQARAFLNQRAFVTPDDVQQMAVPVLSVRLGVDHGDPLPVIRELLETVPLPEYRRPSIAVSDHSTADREA